MVDLNEAGSRLATHPTGPPTPVDELRRRVADRARRRHRRRAGGFVVLAAVVVAAVIGAVRLSSRPDTQTVSVGPNGALTQPVHRVSRAAPVAHSPGSTPIDWGQLRLWLPPGWTVTGGPQNGAPECWTPPEFSVYLTSSPLPACAPTSKQKDESVPLASPSVEVTPLVKPVPKGWVRRVINSVDVWSPSVPKSTESRSQGLPAVFAPLGRLDIPSLHVTIVATVAGTDAVVDSLGPSALHTILAQAYPVAVPASWRTVTFDGFRAEVPAGWPIHHARTVSTGDSVTESGGPPFCGGRRFDDPSLFVGEYTGFISCPAIFGNGLLEADTVPTDGLWLQTAVAGTLTGHQDGSGAGPVEHVISGTVRLGLGSDDRSGSSTVTVDAAAGGHTLEAPVGLGIDPAVAEEVISSLRPVGTRAPTDPAAATRPETATSPTTATTPTTAGRPDTGTLQGTAEACPGPSGQAPRNEKVLLEIKGPSGAVRRLVLTDPWHYSVALPPATYHVGEVDSGSVSGRPVTVQAGRASTVDVWSDCG